MDVHTAIEATGAAYDALGLLAAPRVFAVRRDAVDADVIRTALLRFVDLAERLPVCTDNQPIIGAVPMIRHLIADLPPSFSESVPRPLVEAARTILAQIEFPTPEEGWDEWGKDL